MDESFVAAEVSRLGMTQLSSAVENHGVIVLQESTVAREQLIRIFQNRHKRAEARGDRKGTRLVANLLSAFGAAQSNAIKLIHVQVGSMDVMLYGEIHSESILAAVILSGAEA